MTVGSLFAGIGGFDLGFERAGCFVRWQVEQDGKAQSVLGHRFPKVQLHDDVRTVGAGTLEPVDVICGGFPCQDVSVAGKREGLGGERTGLFSEVVRIARELSPRWMVLENVPGLLSSHGGRDFHTVLAALAECGFRREYRILDSRYFGVAQRRRRVFLVLRARGRDERPEPVLFESTSRSGDSASGDEARTGTARPFGDGVAFALGADPGGTGQAHNTNYVSAFNWQSGGDCRLGFKEEHTDALHSGQTPAVFGVHANQRGELRTSSIAGSLNGSRSGKQFEGVFASSGERERALAASMHKRHDEDTDTLIATLDTSLGHHRGSLGVGDFTITATLNGGGNDGGFRTEPGEHLIAATLSTTMHKGPLDNASADTVQSTSMGVRRLTPLECERLQGFPDGWTCLCGEGHRGSKFCTCADSPRYRQLGNAVTVPVAEWIARRILTAEAGV